MTRPRTEQERWGEVERWRASGESAAAYANRHGYSRASLANWAAALKRSAAAIAKPRFVRLEVATSSAAELCIEVGEARVRVKPGFNAALLREVITALGSGRAR
jgi:hypothetical protein